jgi:hypothetical protein
MLWILALPVLALVALFAYALGYMKGKRVGAVIARRRDESWREMRYCGTALLHMEEISKEVRRPGGRKTALRLVDDGGG